MKPPIDSPTPGETKVAWRNPVAADNLEPEMKHKSPAGQKSKSVRKPMKTAVERNDAPFGGPSISAKQIRLLRASFAWIQPQADIAALAFYRNLFTLEPSLRALFHSSIELQGRKLMEALGYTIATLENPRALIPVLESLGRRHVAYGAREEHYPVVADALLHTLAEILARDFTPDVRRAWSEALAFVADAMKRGASPVQELSQPAGDQKPESKS